MILDSSVKLIKSKRGSGDWLIGGDVKSLVVLEVIVCVCTYTWEQYMWQTINYNQCQEARQNACAGERDEI